MRISEDLLFANSMRKFLTFKHTSIDLELHSITGKKLPILYLHRDGHCTSPSMANCTS